jgi:hypothetical protein
MRVRVGSLYVYSPNGWDRIHPLTGNNLLPGQVVRVINLPMAPVANTMGQCYVADPGTGKFICMVSTGSLDPAPARKGTVRS